MPAGLDTPLTEEQVNVLFAASRPEVRKPARVQRKRTTVSKSMDAPARTNANATHFTDDKPDSERAETPALPFVQRFLSGLSDALLIAVVVGHGLLIVQELSQMAGRIGRTSGFMVLLSIIAAVSLSSGSRWHGVSGGFVWFVFVLDCAATYLHYRAFEPYVGGGLAIGLAITVSAVSFFALYFYREKNSDLFDGY